MVRGPRPERAGRAKSAEERGTKPPSDGGGRARGAVVFMTGLSGAGKSTIAEALAGRPRRRGPPGDDPRRRRAPSTRRHEPRLRPGLARAADPARRRARRGGRGERPGRHRGAHRAVRPRARSSPARPSSRSRRSCSTWVRTPLEVAEARDPKGLYKKVRAGEIGEFTGISSPFEEPEDADLVIDTTSTPVPEAVARIRAALDAALEGRETRTPEAARTADPAVACPGARGSGS